MANEKSVLVTGASTGIGWGVTKVLSGSGFHVYGTVRRQTDADRLQAEFGGRVTPLLMDVTDADAVARCAATLSERLGDQTLSGLVNNAGVAVAGPLLYLPVEELRRQMEVNLTGPLQVIQAFAPLLGTDRQRRGKPGRIINMSSVAGKLGPPFLGAYAASKHALEGLSESLRRELLLFGIDVVVIGPGAVVTAIWDKAETDDLSQYADTEYAPVLERFRKEFIADGRKGLPPEQLGATVLRALTARRPKVRYAVAPQRFKNWTLPMLLPKRMLDRLIGKQLGFPALPR